MSAPRLRARRLGIDTYRHAVVFVRADCPVCRAEGFSVPARLRVASARAATVVTLNVVTSNLLGVGEIGLSDEAWRRLEPVEGEALSLEHAPHLTSFSHVRAKMYGHRLAAEDIREVVSDLHAGLYGDVHAAAFVTACAGDRLDLAETTALTRAMIDVGTRLSWPSATVLDKHCVGGLPGNRTTPIVVAIVAAAGLLIPKTSSRAITSPAGTADVVDTFTRSALSLDELRAVVEREGGCLAWGGSVDLSPVDDLLVQVERMLDVDSEGQLVASVLSKKAAAGSTHVVVDIPVGPTAKVRSPALAATLAQRLVAVGEAVGLVVDPLLTDGTQPVGRGVGPALEAREVLAVLRNDPLAASDLRDRAVALAGRLLEIGGVAAVGRGVSEAAHLLDSGRAWSKLVRICEAQGGFREPPIAPYTAEVPSPRAGTVQSVDNRGLSRVAKLAGAPTDPSAGLWIHVRPGDPVIEGQPLFTLHAESRGELAWALDHVAAHPHVVAIGESEPEREIA